MIKHLILQPKTRAERWAWLIADAKQILARPLDHSRAEVAWARDVIATQNR